MRELMFLKVLMLIKQVHQMSVAFVVFFRYRIYLCTICSSRCHNVLITSIGLDSVAILNVHGVYYQCILN